MRLVLCLLLGVHATIVALAAYRDSPTVDELAHMAAGVSHWELGRFDLYRVNPPLVRVVATLPVVLTGGDVDWTGYGAQAGNRCEFRLGQRWASRNRQHLRLDFFLARLACIPFSILGAVICFLWARDLFGDRSGLLACGLWCFCPLVLGNAHLITPDVGATSLGLAAMYVFRKSTYHPTFLNACVTGLLLGLALLSKTTLLILLPIVVLQFVIWQWIHSRETDRGSLRKLASRFLLHLCLALLVVNAGYGFESSFRKLGEFTFVSKALAGEADRPGNRFRGTCLAKTPVPFPANYVMGIDTQKRDFERGGLSYLRGEWRHGGWTYYYLYGLIVKTPAGGLLLCGLAITWVLQGNGRAACWDELMLALPPFCILLLVSLQTGFNHHLRYVLPILPFLFISVSRVAESVRKRHRLIGTATMAGFCAFVVGSLSICPHSLSYFNELIGGPRHGDAHFVDSNIDWGQDLFRLIDWLEDHENVEPIRLAYFGQLPPEILGVKYRLPPRLIRCPEGGNGFSKELTPGWYAVSVSLLRGLQYSTPNGRLGTTATERNSFAYLRHLVPTRRVGYSICLYYLDDEQVRGILRNTTNVSEG